MKKLTLALLLLPFVVSAQTTIPSVAGLTPQSPFYLIDRLGEVLRELVAFSPAAKIRLQVSYAAERIAEIKIEMEAKEVDVKGLNVAQKRLEKHLSKAARLLLKEKSEGKDVDDLEDSIKEEMEESEKVLQLSFQAAKDALENEEEILEQQLEVAEGNNDVALIQSLKLKLEALEAEEEKLEDEMEAQIEALEENREDIDDEDEDEDDSEEEEDELGDVENDLESAKND